MVQMTPEEQEQSLILASMGDIDEHTALRVLRKHNGNMQAAADAILSGDRGASPPPQKVTSVDPTANAIDLTGDDNDEEMKRALQLSMTMSDSVNAVAAASNTQTAQFKPSDRAPDPNWAMVPSNVATQSTSQDDENLKEAIKASLAEPDDDDTLPEKLVRDEDGRPVALRPDDPNLQYAALVLHALYHVPQVRQRISRMMLPGPELNLEEDSAEIFICKLVELFTNLDLIKLSTMIENDIFRTFAVRPAASTDLPAEISRAFVEPLARIIEECLRVQVPEDNPRPPLFTFTSGTMISNRNPPIHGQAHPGVVVTVDVGHNDSSPNELVSRLAANLHHINGDIVKHDGIKQPSETVIFQLSTQASFSSSNLSMANEGFVYPKRIYMDRFLLQNFELTSRKNREQRDIANLIQELEAKKEEVTKSDNTDTLANLKTTINYYETVARDGNTPDRRKTLDNVTQQLKAVLAALESTIERIDADVANLRNKISTLFDCPELQQNPYDLRAVLVHTGLSGRKHLYSYVQDPQGRWWKTVNYTVTQVSEDEVLGDTKGVALGAGPYMLIYSRSLTPEQLSEPCPWPDAYVQEVIKGNQGFLDALRTPGYDTPGTGSGTGTGGGDMDVETQSEARDAVPDLPPRPKDKATSTGTSLAKKASEDASMADMSSHH
ncbi:hypothetical protein VKT23_015188 [Stygiomarasmius scandens]|uniref:USP domain-containing protein n=1 Tax=Marasmiellus scandens TaxID=2682957 RepID=A0ABR1J113_9AGAR